MRIALIARNTLFTAKGGDTIQISETAKALQQLGIQADILLSHEKLDYSNYHLFHFFNLTRPADILPHLPHIKQPVVLTPIYINYQNYDAYARSGLSRFFFRQLSEHRAEYAKTVARWLNGSDQFPGYSFLSKGQKRSILSILERTSALITVGESEFRILQEKYGKLPPHVSIPLGLSPVFLEGEDTRPKEKDLILCVGRIEGIKNQLNLIRAVNRSHYRLLIIGAPAPNQLSYYRACVAEASANIQFMDFLPQQELLQHYVRANVHAQPSFFENFGLSTLESAALGCKIVTTENGFIHDVIGSNGFYCDPADPSSILNSIRLAMEAEPETELRQKIRKMSWEKAAQQIIELYRSLLS